MAAFRSLGQLSAEVLEENGRSLSEIVKEKGAPEEILKYSPKHFYLWITGGESKYHVTYHVTYNGHYLVRQPRSSLLMRFKTSSDAARYLFLAMESESRRWIFEFMKNDITQYEKITGNHYSGGWLTRARDWACIINTLEYDIGSSKKEEIVGNPQLSREKLEEILKIQQSTILEETEFFEMKTDMPNFAEIYGTPPLLGLPPLPGPPILLNR